MCQSIIRHGVLKFEGEGKGAEMLKEQLFFVSGSHSVLFQLPAL